MHHEDESITHHWTSWLAHWIREWEELSSNLDKGWVSFSWVMTRAQNQMKKYINRENDIKTHLTINGKIVFFCARYEAHLMNWFTYIFGDKCSHRAIEMENTEQIALVEFSVKTFSASPNSATQLACTLFHQQGSPLLSSRRSKSSWEAACALTGMKFEAIPQCFYFTLYNSKSAWALK